MRWRVVDNVRLNRDRFDGRSTYPFTCQAVGTGARGVPSGLGGSRRHCPGVTLIELMVVLSILGLLVSLLLPAVQEMRESVRRLQCANQLRQLALGMMHHESRLRRLPGNGGWDDDSLVENVDGELVPIRTHDLQIDSVFRWGVGRPGARPQEQPGSWAYAILPDIEQGAAYRSIQVEQAGPLFRCPSRSRAAPQVPVDDENGRYESAGRVWAKTDYAANVSVCPNRPDALSLAEITDGLSQTLLLGEKAFDPTVQVATSWYWDEPIFSGGSKGTGRVGLLIQPDRAGIEYKENWGSPHRGVANFSLVDSATRSLSREIDWQVLRALLSPAGGEVLEMPP